VKSTSFDKPARVATLHRPKTATPDHKAPDSSKSEPPARFAPVKFRLVVVTSLFPPAVGGASEDFRLLAQAWQEAEAVESVIILTERREGSPTRQARGKAVVRRLLPATRRVKRHPGPFYIASRLWMYALLTAAAAWYLRRQKSRLVLVHARYGRKTFLRALKLLGARVVVLLSDHFRAPENLAGCDAVICVTDSVYERARSKLSGACQVHYVPLPLELPQARGRAVPPADANTPYFLFLGELSRWKGVDVLLEAFAAFRRDHPEYRLLLAGPVCDPTLPGTDCPGATFLGEVDHETALGLIERAEALVLPSRSEGLPRVCLEAIALGTKVICPPGVPELQRACPEWVLPGVTTQDVLEKLRQAAGSPFRPSFDFGIHEPQLVGKRILEVCAAVLRDGAHAGASAEPASSLPHQPS
jgi:glycosyltransferase involved in cell wall biosynthesis